MINKSKFLEIARVYTKEYLGTDEYGKDKEYEDELTNAFSDYLISIFYNTGYTKQQLRDVMSKKRPQHPSNILPIIL